MLKHVTFAGVFALFAGAATAQDADSVVATIGDTEITLGEMIIVRAQLPQQYRDLPNDVLFTGILDQLIQQQLLADSAGAVPPRVAYALSNETRSLMAGEAINVIAEGAVSEEAVVARFEEMTSGATPGEEWNASHLLVETEEEAIAARDRIEAGEEFADVARDVSTGPSGPNGGQLGWFSAGMMVPAFEEAVQTLETGGLSGPVETQFGWHIVTLNDKRTLPLPELDAMRRDIEAALQEEAITARLAELEAETEVTRPEEGAFDPELLDALDLLEPK